MNCFIDGRFIINSNCYVLFYFIDGRLINYLFREIVISFIGRLI